MRMRVNAFLLSCLLVAAAAAAGACSDNATVPATDAGSVAEEDAGADVEIDRPEEREDAGTGSTFTDLYRDFFGPTGKASCSGDGLCHGASTAAGAKGSGGFVCGSDATACWTSMTSGRSALVTTADAADPTKSALYLTIRHRRTDGSLAGSMPKRPLYVFSTASMQRIAAWVQAGAPND